MKNIAVLFCGLSLVGLVAAPISVRAGTNGFVVPYFRGQTNTQVAGWEVFNNAIGAPGNTGDLPGSSPTPVLTQTDTNAFLTGSGNIYSFSSATVFNITNTVSFPLGQVVFQTRTIGTEMDYSSVRLGYNSGAGTQYVSVPRIENLRESTPAGTAVSSRWIWNLSGLGINTYRIEFNASGSSMSFDSALLDTASISNVPVNFTLLNPVVDRWMYPNNVQPADRPTASLFSFFGTPDSGDDTRLGQHLVGFDTSSLIATNRGATNYLIRRARLTITINRDKVFIYDPTQDAYTTYFATNEPGYQPDSDPGRPIELFGAGFRNGFTPFTFLQDSPFGNEAPGQRNAFSVGYDTNGVLVDVGNNVGKTNVAFPHFEVHPFAIGQTTNCVPGALVPTGSKFTFDLNVADPLVRQYLQQALNSGRLSLMLSALDDSSFGGAPTWPDFFTHFSLAGPGPVLDMEAVAMDGTDTNSDGLPDDWQRFYFSALDQTPGSDADHDGASSRSELVAGSDPVSSTDSLRIVSVTRNAGAFVVRFKFAASRNYAIEYSSDLQSWSSVENPVLTYYSAPGEAVWRDDGSLTGGLPTNRYYRLRVK